MRTQNEKPRGKMVYYFHGSGLLPVSEDRINEIPKVKQEFYDREVQSAWLLLYIRR